MTEKRYLEIESPYYCPMRRHVSGGQLYTGKWQLAGTCNIVGNRVCMCGDVFPEWCPLKKQNE